jgi:hypothetical protein
MTFLKIEYDSSARLLSSEKPPVFQGGFFVSSDRFEYMDSFASLDWSVL